MVLFEESGYYEVGYIDEYVYMGVCMYLYGNAYANVCTHAYVYIIE